MAKSSRSSIKKENNRRKAATIFGPAELARDERLSAKLLELAKQPKPEPCRDVIMEPDGEDDIDDTGDQGKAGDEEETAMDVDTKEPSRPRREGKRRVEKRGKKKSSIVFKKYSDRLAASRKKKDSKKSQ